MEATSGGGVWEGWSQEDTAWGLELEGEGGLWERGFLPPPPRPHFLEPSAQSDGLTTCDLCSWAAQTSFGPGQDGLGLVPWPSTLLLVSILSALVGATLMVSLRRCFKGFRENGVTRYSGSRSGSGRGDSVNKEMDGGAGERRGVVGGSGGGGGAGVWCWLGAGRRGQGAPPHMLQHAPSNHYTMEEAYGPGGGEALYAELDKPVYQNTGYDGETNSAPSSAYYSDLSDRTYETVGPQGPGPQWELLQTTTPLARGHRQLAAISESAPIHSAYV